MAGTSGFFRQRVPAIELSLERNTPGVPNDGWYYVVFRGEIQGRYRQKAQAQEIYSKLLDESGYKPEPVRAPEKNQAVERYLDDLEAYWLDSHKHAKRGGKGRF